MLERIKSNKYILYGGAIIALIGVFIILRGATGGSSSGAVVTASGPTDAQVAAQTQLALAQIQANAQQNSDASNFALQTMQVQAGLTEAQMQADLQKYAIQQDSSNTQAQIAAQSASDQRDADLQAQIAQWTLNQQLQMQASNNAFQLDYANAANSSAVAMANIQAGVVNNQITANENVTIASLQAQAAQLAGYLNAQVAMNDSDNSTQVSLAQINANTEKHKSDNGLFGGIIGGVLGLFSDRRLKEDIFLIGYEADGLAVYSYRYWDSAIHTIGFMADEVRKFRPWLIGEQVGGYDTVNYGAA